MVFVVAMIHGEHSEGRWRGNFIDVSLLDIENCFNINVDFVPVVTSRFH